MTVDSIAKLTAAAGVFLTGLANMVMMVSKLLSAWKRHRATPPDDGKGDSRKGIEVDKSLWRSPWRDMHWADRFNFICIHFLGFVSLIGLCGFGLWFRPEPLTTQSGAILITFGVLATASFLHKL